MNIYGLRLKGLEHCRRVVAIHWIEQGDIRAQICEIILDETTTALRQEPDFAERKVVEIASALNKTTSRNRPGPWLRDFLELRSSRSPATPHNAMFALDHLYGEVFEVQMLSATDGDQL